MTIALLTFATLFATSAVAYAALSWVVTRFERDLATQEEDEANLAWLRSLRHDNDAS